MKLKLTTRALKTIKKVRFGVRFSEKRFLTRSDQYGGLDSYLLNTKTSLLGQEGMRLRVLVRERERQDLKGLENAELPRVL